MKKNIFKNWDWYFRSKTKLLNYHWFYNKISFLIKLPIFKFVEKYKEYSGYLLIRIIVLLINGQVSLCCQIR